MHVRLAALACLVAAGALPGFLGCGRRTGDEPYAPPESETDLTLISFAVDGGEALRVDHPEAVQALGRAAEALAAVAPDLLILQYGHPDVPLADFISRLEAAGLVYPHAEVLAADRDGYALTLLSLHPVVARRSEARPGYRIGNRQHHVEPGILDVDLVAGPHGLVRVVAACLKDKVFHVSGQTEMRRNEARILGRRLRQAGLDTGGAVVVAAVVNDAPSSAPIKEIAGPPGRRLAMLRPADDRGDTWTMGDPAADRYERSDYLLLSSVLAARQQAHPARILDAPALRAISRHRALAVCFKAPRETGVRDQGTNTISSGKGAPAGP